MDSFVKYTVDTTLKCIFFNKNMNINIKSHCISFSLPPLRSCAISLSSAKLHESIFTRGKRAAGASRPLQPLIHAGSVSQHKKAGEKWHLSLLHSQKHQELQRWCSQAHGKRQSKHLKLISQPHLGHPSPNELPQPAQADEMGKGRILESWEQGEVSKAHKPHFFLQHYPCYI